MILWVFIAVVIVMYFGWLAPVHPTAVTLPIILIFSLVGIAGSYGVAGFGIRVNTLQIPALRLPACAASLSDLQYATAGRHEHRHDAHQRRAADDALHPAVHSGRLPGPCFIGFAIGESLGAAALRIAGGIFTKIADIGSDLMKIVFKIKEDDARNPGVIADCTAITPATRWAQAPMGLRLTV